MIIKKYRILQQLIQNTMRYVNFLFPDLDATFTLLCFG